MIAPEHPGPQPGPPMATKMHSTPVAPTEFAQGACVALPPLSDDRHRTLFIDAGHGGTDPGATGTTASGQPVQEKQLTLAVARKVAWRLRQHGYRVVLSRTGDTTVAPMRAPGAQQEQLSAEETHTDVVARAHCANLAGAAELISIHFDAFDDPGAGGASTVYDMSRSFATHNKHLAELTQRNVLAALAAHGQHVDDRGIMTDDSSGGPALSEQGDAYGHLVILGPAAPNYVPQPSQMPGVLIEPMYITNPAEASVASSENGQNALSEGIAAALEQAAQG